MSTPPELHVDSASLAYAVVFISLADTLSTFVISRGVVGAGVSLLYHEGGPVEVGGHTPAQEVGRVLLKVSGKSVGEGDEGESGVEGG